MKGSKQNQQRLEREGTDIPLQWYQLPVQRAMSLLRLRSTTMGKRLRDRCKAGTGRLQPPQRQGQGQKQTPGERWWQRPYAREAGCGCLGSPLEGPTETIQGRWPRKGRCNPAGEDERAERRRHRQQLRARHLGIVRRQRVRLRGVQGLHGGRVEVGQG